MLYVQKRIKVYSCESKLFIYLFIYFDHMLVSLENTHDYDARNKDNEQSRNRSNVVSNGPRICNWIPYDIKHVTNITHI